MFIRWKHRASAQVTGNLPRGRRGRIGFPGSTTHYAYLVETSRVDGKPRQRVIAYLGCIADGDGWRAPVHRLSNPSARYWFWRDARAKLDAVPLAAAVRARCEAALAAVVPLPSTEETAQMEQALAAFKAADAAAATRSTTGNGAVSSGSH